MSIDQSKSKYCHIKIRNTELVALLETDYEFVCLAQLSVTLLKDFNYNQINNRRMSLGIEAVQCTAEQLELLKSACAAPCSMKRSGMIKRQDAERLVKSFLDDNQPLNLVKNLIIVVEHEFGWGCKGEFHTSLYNHSRAKCIRCLSCKIFLSPNKFTFHGHHRAGKTYNKRNTANLNLWRRHLKMINPTNDEIIRTTWDEIKASFHGFFLKRDKKSSNDQWSDNSDCDSNVDMELFKSISRKELCYLFYKMEEDVTDAKTSRRIERGKCNFCHYTYKDTKGHYGNFKTHIISQHKKIAELELKEYLGRRQSNKVDWILPQDQDESATEHSDYDHHYEPNEATTESRNFGQDDRSDKNTEPNQSLVFSANEMNVNTKQDSRIDTRTTSLTLYHHTHPKQMKFTKSLVKNLVINAGMSVSIVDTQGFKAFQSEIDIQLAPITSHDIATEFLPEFEKRVNTQVDKLLKNVDKITITCDIWTDRSLNTLLGR